MNSIIDLLAGVAVVFGLALIVVLFAGLFVVAVAVTFVAVRDMIAKDGNR